MKEKDCRPEAVKRVWIPKPNGKLHPLGISTITDRVVQQPLDRHVLPLIKQWLEAPLEEDDEHVHRKRTASNRDAGRGAPQWAPIYFHRGG